MRSLLHHRFLELRRQALNEIVISAVDVHDIQRLAMATLVPCANALHCSVKPSESISCSK